MSTPVSLGMLSTFLIQVIDTYFIGRLGSAHLAALSFASVGFFLVVGLFMGLSVGVSALAGSALGAKNLARVKRLTTLSILFGFTSALAIGLIGVFTIEPFFLLLGAEASLLPLITEYMQIIYLSFPLLIIATTGNAVIRSAGHVRIPEIIMALGGGVNLILDYLLIFGIGPFPELGIQGAALATAISFVFVCLSTLFLLYKHKLAGFKGLRSLSLIKKEYSALLTLSLPAIATQLLVPLGAMFITFIIAKFGSNAVAAYGIASRIEALVLVGIIGLSVALTPFVAQNFGAKKYKRIDEAIIFVGKYSVYMGLFLFVLLVLFAKPIATIFTSDPEIVKIVSLYFYFVAFSYVFYSFLSVTSSLFNAIQLPKKALRLLIVKTVALTVPFVIIGSYFGIAGIFIGLAASNVLSGLYAGRVMNTYLRTVGSSVVSRKPIDDYKQDIKKIFRK